MIDAAPAGHLAQPEHQVPRRFDGPEMAVQLQKNLLRQFLGDTTVVQEVVSQAKNHALLLPNDVGERR